MKQFAFTIALILGLIRTDFAQSEVQFTDGLYTNPDGSRFTGEAMLEANGTSPKQHIQIVNGLMHGEIRYFNSSGKIEEIGHYNSGKKDGLWSQFGSGGEKLGEAYYKEGKKDGIWTVWDENGVKRYHMVYSMGKKIDTWKMWDEHSNLVSEKVYNE